MRKLFVVLIATCLYQANASATVSDVPAQCKNLALMEGQLLNTVFSVGGMDGTNNPPTYQLQTNNGFGIGKIDYLGGDSEDTTGPNAGTYPCDTQPKLCARPGDAGGSNDWSRVTITQGGYNVATVVVSYGSRGGCNINSAAIITQ